ncbi:hypothetical protein ACBR40_10135 [Nonomuraea sp. AD125B]|uniref:hypothetical protein n=1 Tax=Nonomuraea sp. AD125B TaxID=3242897 RepID=UPI0035288A8D
MTGEQRARFQGLQINYGGYVHQTNTFAAPSLDDELRSLRAHNRAHARQWILDQDAKLRRTVLNEYEKAHEILNDICAHQGAALAVELIYHMNPKRLMWLLERLDEKHQQAAFFELSIRLAQDGKVAEYYVRDYAAVDQIRTAHLLINVACMAEAGPGRALELLPSYDFALSLPDWFAVRLLEALIFDHRNAGPQTYGYTREAYTVLIRLLNVDDERTIRLIVQFPPDQRSKCLFLLPLISAADLLTAMTEVSQEAAIEVVHTLPWPIARAVVGRVAWDMGRKLEGPGETTWWPWLDGICAALAYLPHTVHRVRHNGGPSALTTELKNLRDVRKAATWAIKDANFYRHQRNHLGWLAIAQMLILLILLIILVLT